MKKFALTAIAFALVSGSAMAASSHTNWEGSTDKFTGTITNKDQFEDVIKYTDYKTQANLREAFKDGRLTAAEIKASGISDHHFYTGLLSSAKSQTEYDKYLKMMNGGQNMDDNYVSNRDMKAHGSMIMNQVDTKVQYVVAQQAKVDAQQDERMDKVVSGLQDLGNFIQANTPNLPEGGQELPNEGTGSVERPQPGNGIGSVERPLPGQGDRPHAGENNRPFPGTGIERPEAQPDVDESFGVSGQPVERPMPGNGIGSVDRPQPGNGVGSVERPQPGQDNRPGAGSGVNKPFPGQDNRPFPGENNRPFPGTGEDRPFPGTGVEKPFPGQGERPYPGTGEGSVERPQPGNGVGSIERPRPGNGEGAIERPMPGENNRPGAGTGSEKPFPGQGNRPYPGNGEGSVERPFPGQDNRPQPGTGIDQTLPEGDYDSEINRPRPGSGEGSVSRPQPGAGEGSIERPQPGQGNRPQPGTGNGSVERPQPGNGAGSVERPRPGQGEGSVSRPQPGENNRPQPGVDNRPTNPQLNQAITNNANNIAAMGNAFEQRVEKVNAWLNQTGNAIQNNADKINGLQSSFEQQAAHTGREIARLDGRIDALEANQQKLKAGIASATAIATLSQHVGAGNHNIAVAVGGYDGESAVAAGYTYIFDDRRTSFRATISTDSESEVAMGMSIGHSW